MSMVDDQGIAGVTEERPKSGEGGDELDRPEQTFYQKNESLILGGVSLLLTLGIWQAFWAAGKISPLFFSGPSAIAKRFWDALINGSLGSDLKYSGTNFAVSGAHPIGLYGHGRLYRRECGPGSTRQRIAHSGKRAYRKFQAFRPVAPLCLETP